MSFSGKTIIVTGAGSGIGRELSIALVKRGAFAILADVHEAALNETAEIAGLDQVSTFVFDVSDRGAAEQFVKEAIEKHTHIDGLINNAGIIQPFLSIEDLDYPHMERIMDVNFYGTLYLSKALIPHLKTRPEAYLCNVSSMGGFIPFPGQTLYSASKAAVKTLTEGLYAELKNTSVNVTVIHPGAVKTNIMENSELESPKPKEGSESSEIPMLPADEAARQILEAMEKKKFRATVGKDARMLDFIYRLHPRYAVDLIVKKMGAMVPKS